MNQDHSLDLNHSSGAKRRIFWALPLEDRLRTVVSTACEKMRKSISFRKWTHPLDYHITLVFLGEMEDVAIPHYIRAARETAARHKPFRLCLSSPGTFGGRGGAAPKVLWFGVSGQTEKLASLQRELAASFVSLGYSPETRPYAPHLTVARRGAHPLGKEQLQRMAQFVFGGDEPAFRHLQSLQGVRGADGTAAKSPGSDAPPDASPPSTLCWDVDRIVLYETRMGHSPMYRELVTLSLGR